MFLLYFPKPLFSHEKHEGIEREKEEIIEIHIKEQEDVEKTEEKYKLPPLKEILFSHLHNKLVHAILILPFVAFLFLLFPSSEKQGRFLLILTLLFTVPVYFTGENQSKFFEGKEKEYLVELHENFGIFTILSIWFFTFISFINLPKLIKILFGFIVILLLITTGLFGGIVAH